MSVINVASSKQILTVLIKYEEEKKRKSANLDKRGIKKGILAADLGESGGSSVKGCGS